MSLKLWMLALLLPTVALAAPLGTFEDHADIGKPKLTAVTLERSLAGICVDRRWRQHVGEAR